MPNESAVRRLAMRRGYYVRKSRRYRPPDNFGEFMLLDIQMNVPVAGFQFDASLEEIGDWLKDDE